MSEVLRKTKNHIVFCIFALLLGLAAGAVVWAFFLLMEWGLEFFWTFLPEKFPTPVYPVLVCLVGGVVIGVWQKKFGEYPKTLDSVLMRVKQTHRIEYDNLWVVFVAALLPLIFGGCIGPEAGLTGAIAAICTWMGDHFRYAAKQTKDLAEIGASATLSVVFGAAPLLGVLSPLEMSDENPTSKKSKFLVYCFGVIGALISYALLNLVVAAGMVLPYFETANASGMEFLWMIPLGLIGALAGFLYFLFGKGTAAFMKLFGRAKIAKAIFGGLVLGTVGIFLPYTMFAGETQMQTIAEQWSAMGFGLLLLTGVVKLLIGQICLHSGWRGGNIFPIVFSGVCIGFACSFFIPVDPHICIAVVTSALCGSIMKRPLLVVLVLFLCFPPTAAFQLIVGAAIGTVASMPKKPEKA